MSLGLINSNGHHLRQFLLANRFITEQTGPSLVANTRIRNSGAESVQASGQFDAGIALPAFPTGLAPGKG